MLSTDDAAPGDRLVESFRIRLNALFAERDAAGIPVTNKEVASWMQANGYPLSPAGLSQLRSGASGPSLRTIEGLAAYFGVDSALLLSEAEVRSHLGEILSNPEVQGVALRASRLTPEALQALSALMDQMLPAADEEGS